MPELPVKRVHRRRDLPADRLEELNAKVLSTAELATGHYRPLTRSINILWEWGCLQRITESLKHSDAKWGYRRVNPNGKRDGNAKFRAVEIWRIMPKDLLSANTERHRRIYRMEKARKQQNLP